MNRKLIADYLAAMALQRRTGLYQGMMDDALDTVAIIRKLRQLARKLP
jgi:hypothetical protein